MEKYSVRITGLNDFGMGVCKIEGLVVFVKDALPGEEVEIAITEKRKNFALGCVVSYLKKEDDRQETCPHFLKCGSCNLLHLAYAKQLAYKQNKVYECMMRIGKLKAINYPEIIPSRDVFYYRNKVKMSFGVAGKTVICGYYMQGSHCVISVSSCKLISLVAMKIIKYLLLLINEYGISAWSESEKKGKLRHLVIRSNRQNEVMLVLVMTSPLTAKEEEIARKLKEKCPELSSFYVNINKEAGNAIFGEKDYKLLGEDKLKEELCGIKFYLTYKSFCQINYSQAERLYQTVEKYIRQEKCLVVADLYCGIGIMTLYLAKILKFIYGIEIVPAATRDAKEAARINHIDNVLFICADVSEGFPMLPLSALDGIIVDPPRKGLDGKVCDLILSSGIATVIYVSCNVATFARDVALLSDKYVLRDYILVDMFPQTTGVEIVGCLKEKGD